MEENPTVVETVEEAKEEKAVPPEQQSEPELVFNDSIDLPQGWQLVQEAGGDLDKDGQEERVQVVEAETEEEYPAPERRIRIYQQGEGAWRLWQEVSGGILGADEGGMFGDPFQEISIERGCIVVNHYGGSRIRWNYIHRYRWQNTAWEMIGTTITYGAPCDYWHEFDYNLSTGKVVGKMEIEDCDGENSSTDQFEFSNKIGDLPRLETHDPGTTEVAVPGRDLTFFF